MIIDITDFDVKRMQSALDWLKESNGDYIYAGEDRVVLHSDRWRVYKTENSIEGFYETSWFLEFDSESDGTAFLLRWS
jgi:hypothetical protein